MRQSDRKASPRPHLRDGTLRGAKWTPKKSELPPRGTTHAKTRKASTADARAATYASWITLPISSMWAVFVPVVTTSIGNDRGRWSIKAAKDKQQRALFDALCVETGIPDMGSGAVVANLRPALPVVVRLVRITKAKSRIDRHAEWHKHLVDECARWLGCDDADARVTWLFGHEVGPVRGVRIEVRARTSEMEAAFANADAMVRRAVGW